jgi:nucleotide-binding universal stress UspA family protein
MKTILIPTDFSTTALNAAKYISAMCKKTETERLILYHSYEIVHPDTILLTDILEPPPSQLGELENEAIRKLDILKKTLSPLVNDGTVIEYITNDLPLIEGIDEIIINEKIDLVTVGISGTGNDGKNVIGSNTLQIMKECKTSLLIVPSAATFNGIKQSMLAVDLHDIAGTIPVAQLKELLLKLSSKLVVVNVEHHETMGADTLMKKETILHHLLNDLNPEYDYPDNKNKAEGLLMFAEKQNINLIIVVHRKYGLVEQLFHSSITKKLAIKTSTPLIILHKN